MIVLSHPYDSKLSKNSRLANRTHKSREKREATRTIGMQILPHRQRFVPAGRLYMGIILFRTHRRTDPQNLIELVADAVAAGTGVDDNNFVIVTWAVDVKKDQAPFFLVWATQDRSEYLRAIASESPAEIVEMSEAAAGLTTLQRH